MPPNGRFFMSLFLHIESHSNKIRKNLKSATLCICINIWQYQQNTRVKMTQRILTWYNLSINAIYTFYTAVSWYINTATDLYNIVINSFQILFWIKDHSKSMFTQYWPILPPPTWLFKYTFFIGHKFIGLNSSKN